MITISRPTIIKTAGVAKLLVWAAVFIWCLAPVIWALATYASSRDNARKNAAVAPMPPREGPGDDGLLHTLAASAVMLGAFVYAIWCCTGVILGFAVDRVISIFETIACADAEKKAQAAVNPFETPASL